MGEESRTGPTWGSLFSHPYDLGSPDFRAKTCRRDHGPESLPTKHPLAQRDGGRTEGRERRRNRRKSSPNPTHPGGGGPFSSPVRPPGTTFSSLTRGNGLVPPTLESPGGLTTTSSGTRGPSPRQPDLRLTTEDPGGKVCWVVGQKPLHSPFPPRPRFPSPVRGGKVKEYDHWVTHVTEDPPRRTGPSETPYTPTTSDPSSLDRRREGLPHSLLRTPPVVYSGDGGTPGVRGGRQSDPPGSSLSLLRRK